MSRPLLRRSLARRSIAAATLSVAAALSADASAQSNAVAPNNGDGFDTHLFRPALDSKGFFTLNGVDVLGHQDPSFGLIIDYGRALLRVNEFPGSRAQLVEHSFQGTAHFNYGLFNRLVLGISLPLNLMTGDERGPNPAAVVPGWTIDKLDSQTLGYIALHGKLRLLRVEDGVGLAVAVQLGVPVSDAPKNGGADPGAWYWPTVIAEKRLAAGRLRLAVNAGLRGHSASTTALALRDGTFKDGSRLTYGAGASYRILEAVDLVAETYGTYLLSDASGGVKPSNEAVGGIKVFVEKNSYLMLGGGTRYTNGFEAADARGFIGFVFEPSIGDRDGDGVKDDEDACPDVPGVRTDDPKTNGCPGDRDHDGVIDDEDACPDVPGIRTNIKSTNGCPPYRPPPPEPPKPEPPKETDRDHDGVPDVEDACPDVPGKRHSDPKRNGCPDVLIKDNDILIFEKINFATASAVILPTSFELLDKIAETMKTHPEFTLVEVAGHADERGGAGYNVGLTTARAASVVAALVQRKVERERLRSKGYGYYCPEDQGHNEAAWEKNRRVEFKIVKTTDGPTGVQLGCDAATKVGLKPDPVK